MRTLLVMIVAVMLGGCQSDNPKPGTAGSPGMSRLSHETPGQCRQRMFPAYDDKDLALCMAACTQCYTTSAGTGCESFCRREGAS